MELFLKVMAFIQQTIKERIPTLQKKLAKKKSKMLKNIYIILVEPIYNGNLGSVARAMKNYGLKNLILVNPEAEINSTMARKMSVSAYAVLKNSVVYDKLENAVEDFEYLVGTTNRKRAASNKYYTAKGITGRILKFSKKFKIGILFGREDKGLSNEELAYVNDIINIPTSPKLSSLNLAQAVLIVGYEIYQKLNEKGLSQTPDYLAANLKRKEHLFKRIEKLLDTIKFSGKHKRIELFHSIKYLLNRAVPSNREIDILQGVFKEISRKIKKEGD
ncbi:MAG: RNA methyltransferase [Candidatus Mcinerneyibacterium aminivorans]|uniref:tRNA (cytidine/uridine-2'-O-)-methyltransferase TrmJ n=1 Tax=Candidatus Mcinerneyibacterium aminivorans TaxID=2703815 RepID=A0A5D0MJ33_9BACT|nr:MAG: RNA methyltransferase [Candidatus Mcinerneyibacterium aminivorans]